MPHTKDNNTKVIDKNEINKRRETKKIKKTYITLACAGVVLVIFLIVFFAAGGYEKILDLIGIERDVSVTPTIISVEAEIKGNVLLAGKDGTVLVYDEQGVTGYGADGKWRWYELCSVSNPMVADCRAFSVIADVGGTAAYAFNQDGLLWKYGSENVIKSVFGNSKHICIIHDESEYLSAVTVYEYDEKTGTLKELFTRKFGSHYMVAGAISPDGKQIVLSGVLSEGGTVRGILSFLRMSDGEIFSSEVFENGAFVKIFTTSDNSVFAVNSNSARALYKSLSVSSKDDINNILWDRNNKQDYIIDAAATDENKLILAIGNETSKKGTVKVYDNRGKESLNIEVDGNIIGVDAAGENFLVYTQTHAYLYNERGLQIGMVEAGFKIKQAICTNSRNIGISGEGKLLTISFD